MLINEHLVFFLGFWTIHLRRISRDVNIFPIPSLSFPSHSPSPRVLIIVRLVPHICRSIGINCMLYIFYTHVQILLNVAWLYIVTIFIINTLYVLHIVLHKYTICTTHCTCSSRTVHAIGPL